MSKFNIESVSEARAAAYLAVYHWKKNGIFLDNSLERWYKTQNIGTRERSFARQVAIGTVQRQRSLRYLITKLVTKPNALGLQERTLLETAFYQARFMDRVPDYSVVNETVQLAKRYTSHGFAKLVNAVLRSYYKNPPHPPLEWGELYSYPDWYIAQLKHSYSKEQTRQILDAGNQAAPLSIRVREPIHLDNQKLVHQGHLVAVHIQSEESSVTLNDPRLYPMGLTQILLLERLAEHTPEPASILDLCAAPGGKLLAAHDLFPTAALTANEPSLERTHRLKNNWEKYKLDGQLTNYLGQEFPLHRQYDLVIIDAPCSNTGVLNKRPEARWRIDAQAIEAHVLLQKELLQHAAQLLTAKGRIWYMTCSILPQENEEVIAASPLYCHMQTTILPSPQSPEGGFCALLTPQLQPNLTSQIR